MTITRDTMEYKCSDLLEERLKDPLKAVIKDASMEVDEITVVLLIGSSTRIPKVR